LNSTNFSMFDNICYNKIEKLSYILSFKNDILALGA